MSGPLDGTLVLDLSRVLAGPWASQTLADMGARVINAILVSDASPSRTKLIKLVLWLKSKISFSNTDCFLWVVNI